MTEPGYRPGVRGWWAYLRPMEALRDGDGPQWTTLVRRARPSARLRQSEQERAYWKAQWDEGGEVCGAENPEPPPEMMPYRCSLPAGHEWHRADLDGVTLAVWPLTDPGYMGD